MNHSHGLFASHRRQAELHILKDLHKYAAHAEHDQRAKDRVAVHTENDLFARRRHLLHQHPLDDGVSGVAFGIGDNLLEPRHHFSPAGELHQHSPGIRFVDDLRRDDLQNHRQADQNHYAHQRVTR